MIYYFPSSLKHDDEKTRLCKFDSNIEIQTFVKMCFLPVLILRFLANIYFNRLLFKSENDAIVFEQGFFSMNHIHSTIRAVYQGMYFTIVFKNIWVHGESIGHCMEIKERFYCFSMLNYAVIMFLGLIPFLTISLY